MALVRQALEGLPDDDVEHEPMILAEVNREGIDLSLTWPRDRNRTNKLVSYSIQPATHRQSGDIFVGPYINDASKGGRGQAKPGGVEKKVDCVNFVLTREGVKNPENLADVIYGWFHLEAVVQLSGIIVMIYLMIKWNLFSLQGRFRASLQCHTKQNYEVGKKFGC